MNFLLLLRNKKKNSLSKKDGIQELHNKNITLLDFRLVVKPALTDPKDCQGSTSRRKKDKMNRQGNYLKKHENYAMEHIQNEAKRCHLKL